MASSGESASLFTSTFSATAGLSSQESRPADRHHVKHAPTGPGFSALKHGKYLPVAPVARAAPWPYQRSTKRPERCVSNTAPPASGLASSVQQTPEQCEGCRQNRAFHACLKMCLWGKFLLRLLGGGILAGVLNRNATSGATMCYSDSPGLNMFSLSDGLTRVP